MGSFARTVRGYPEDTARVMSRSYAAYAEILDTRRRGPLVAHLGKILRVSGTGAAYTGLCAGRSRTGYAENYDPSRGSSYRQTANSQSQFDDMTHRQYPGGMGSPRLNRPKMGGGLAPIKSVLNSRGQRPPGGPPAAPECRPDGRKDRRPDYRRLRKIRRVGDHRAPSSGCPGD